MTLDCSNQRGVYEVQLEGHVIMAEKSYASVARKQEHRLWKLGILANFGALFLIQSSGDHFFKR